MDLDKANMKKAIPAEIFGEKLKGLKWITFWNLDNPQKEISNLLKAINIIKNDSRNKALVTDYQFISVLMSSYDFSPNKYWYKNHVYPGINHEYFDIYRNFFIKKLTQNQIEVVYIIKPLLGDDNVLDTIIDKKCVKKVALSNILDGYLLSCYRISKN
jgi:hypothetical protein